MTLLMLQFEWLGTGVQVEVQSAGHMRSRERGRKMMLQTCREEMGQESAAQNCSLFQRGTRL